MIKVIRAWADSQGVMHQTMEGAAKAEFARMLALHFWPNGKDPQSGLSIDKVDLTLPFEAVVDAMFEIDKMIGLATKEDTRYESADSVTDVAS